ncbi:MAG: response regulator [Bdellovibrionaceae bacterium]|nr:response regulator [Pseudobdellovibrionaceae bacterium]MBX3033267.1 response regulator [Pseudobdellovibrionaceae bacterium]
MKSASFFKKWLARYGVEAGLFLLLIGAVLTFQNLSRDQNAPAFVTSAVTVEVEKTLQRVRQLESRQQEFLRTLKPRLLTEYNGEITALNQQLNLLSQAAREDDEQRQRVAKLWKNVRRHFELAGQDLISRQKNLPLYHQPDAEKRLAEISGLAAEIARADQRAPLRAPGGGPVLVLIGFAMILLSRFWQRALQKAERRQLLHRSILLDTILNSMSEALVVINEHGDFTHYNAAAQRIVGSRIKDVASEDRAEELGFYPPEGGDVYGLKEIPFTRSLHGETLDDIDILVRNATHPEGLYVSLSSRPLFDIDGRVSGALVVFKDISRRKAVEAEWARAREAAVQASKNKSDFLAAMSHEIRTPMNGVIGMTTLLADTSLNEEQRNYVGSIQRSAQSLLMLINDILDHSKIEAGKVQLHPAPFDLKFLARDVLEIFRPMALEKNVAIELRLDEQAPWHFHGDGGRFRQILVNLVGNAMKFTERGFVRLEVSAAPGEGPSRRLKFEIKDSGPGMSDEECRSLFQRYVQTATGQKTGGGTGLGLSICKQLVGLMGGEIGVSSVPGVGSNFWFTVELPVSAVEETARPATASFQAIFQGRVLVAEDQVVNQKVAGSYLQKLGLQVDFAANGRVAVEKALQGDYDLIFMDCQMPVMNGYEATRLLRAEERHLNKRHTIIALTAEGTSGERKTCFEAGMDDFLTKPLELEHLIRILHKCLNPRGEVLDHKILARLKDHVVQGQDQGLVSALIEDLAQSSVTLIAAMREGAAAGNLTEVTQAAHALRSSCATLGATFLTEICENLEDQTDLSGVDFLIQRLEDQMTKSLQELRSYEAGRKAA